MDRKLEKEAVLCQKRRFQARGHSLFCSWQPFFPEFQGEILIRQTTQGLYFAESNYTPQSLYYAKSIINPVICDNQYLILRVPASYE
jgi:hypothetical protein